MKNRPWSFKKGDWVAVALILALVLTAGLWLPELRSGGSFALIWQDGKFFACQRPEHKARGGLW